MRRKRRTKAASTPPCPAAKLRRVWLMKPFHGIRAGNFLPAQGCPPPLSAAPAPGPLHYKPLINRNFYIWHASCNVWDGPRLGRAGGSEDRSTLGRAPTGRIWGARPMENAVLIGLSRQIALHRELEVVANNVANLNTTGYKADGSAFQEYLMPIARAGAFQASDQRLSYVQDRATWHNFASGPTRQTGNP